MSESRSIASDNALFMADPEAAAIQRRRRLADALRNASPDNIRSHGAGLAHVVQILRGELEARSADRDAQALQTGRAEDAANFWNKAPGAAAPGPMGAAAPPSVPPEAPPVAPMAQPAPAGPQPPANMYGRNAGAVAERDAMLAAPPEQLAQRTAANLPAGQPAFNPANATGPNSAMPGWPADLPPPTGRINPTVGGSPAAPPAAPAPAINPASPTATPPAQPVSDHNRMMAAVMLGLQSPNPIIRQQAQNLMPVVQANLSREDTQTFRREESAVDRAFRQQQLDAQRADGAAGRAQSASQFDQNLALRRQELERGQIPQNYERNPEGGVRPIQGGPADPAQAERIAAARRASATMPAGVQTAEGHDLEIIGTAGNINQMLGRYETLMQRGEIPTTLAGRGEAFIRNNLGASTPQTQNLASFRADMERLRNESLRLNSGVQTEGDAQRAWNELLGNMNDPAIVQRRLREIQGYNQQAIELRRNLINQRRANYNLPELDTSRFSGGSPAQPNAQPSAAPQQGGGWSIRPAQ